MIIKHFDKSSYPITSRTVTDEGFLRVPGHVARTGVQDYLASELGLPGDQNRIIRVMRPECEVFNEDSLATYAGADATNDHPSKLVSPESYKADTVGVCVTSGVRDGDFVKCELVIKDAEAIKAINTGKVQLSAGYTSVYKDAPADVDYDYIQTNIKINHIALVDHARAGFQARLFDNKPQGKTMIIVSLDADRTVEIEDKAVAVLVSDSIDRLKVALDAAVKEKTEAEAKKDKAEDELKEAKKESSDAAISARVAEIAQVQLDARSIAGADFTCDSVDVTEIKRAALTSARPKRDFSTKDAAYIGYAFDAEKDAEEDKEENEEFKKKFAKDAAIKPVTVTDAYKVRCESGTAAWKSTVGVS